MREHHEHTRVHTRSIRAVATVPVAIGIVVAGSALTAPAALGGLRAGISRHGGRPGDGAAGPVRACPAGRSQGPVRSHPGALAGAASRTARRAGPACRRPRRRLGRRGQAARSHALLHGRRHLGLDAALLRPDGPAPYPVRRQLECVDHAQR